MTTRRYRWGRASVVVLVLLLYLPLFSELTRLSTSNPYAGHVIFVPIFAAAVVWTGRHRFRSLTAQGRAAGLSLTAVALVVGWIAYGIGNVPLHVASFLSALAGLLLSFFGRRGIREAAFPLGLLVLMVPPPREAMGAIAAGVQHFVAASSGVILSGFGIPVAQEGIFLRLPGLTLIVAEECSGLRFLLILSVFAAALARTILAPASSRMALIVLSVPIAVLANVMRVTVTTAGAYAIGPDVVTGPLHYYIGKGFWAGALVATIGLALSLRSRSAVSVTNSHSRAGGCVPSVP